MPYSRKAVLGSNPNPSANCPVSGHRAVLWQDIVHRPASAEWVVDTCGVESQGPNELAIFGDDADVGSGDQESDLAVLMGCSDRNVVQLAEIAEGDLAAGVNLVAANAVVGGSGLLCGPGLDECVEDSKRRLPVECSVWPSVVVVGGKRVELKLELGDGASWSLLTKEALDGLVETLDLAAGLRVIRRGVFEDDAQALQLEL